MRLTEPGLYVARDGRVAIFDGAECGILCAQDGVHRPYFSRWFQRDESGVEVPGEWQRIDLAALQWPELPPKPKLVYAIRTREGCTYEPAWWMLRTDGIPLAGWGVPYRELTVCDHPDNDREAVAMIEAAKEEADDAN